MNLGESMTKRINYLNNKDILAEIHKSKSTFCSFTDKEYADFDIILPELSKVNVRTVAEAKRNKAKKTQQRNFEQAKAQGKRVKLAEFEIDYRKIAKEDVIFRIMTYDHIPEEPGRKKNPKTVADTKTKVNFPPFQHYKYNENGELVCVGKSHWEGGMENGYFTKESGKVTNKLALMWMKLCDRYATRGNVRGYTYNDEMRGQAILQLSQIGLQFDESKSNNPFAYYTAAVTNSFVRVINIEKRNQNIRDDILEMNHMNPSYTRQAQGEWERQQRDHGVNQKTEK
jgi:hypothetical protein|tara:strand:+ start:548 stop:1402 length:855 start_codon:yes stop_codon:yes gene_type:complete